MKREKKHQRKKLHRLEKEEENDKKTNISEIVLHSSSVPGKKK
jgi:hypothetical protein